MSSNFACPEDVHRAVELWKNLWRLCKTSCYPQDSGVRLIFFGEIGCIPVRIYGDRRIFVGYNKNEKAS